MQLEREQAERAAAAAMSATAPTVSHEEGSDVQNGRKGGLELPDMLAGLEDLVFEDASQYADPSTPEFGSAVELVISQLRHRISGYRAIGRIATNKNSLPGRLFGST